MPDSSDDLLTALEDITAQALELIDPAKHVDTNLAEPDLDACLRLLKRRGVLIREFAAQYRDCALSYTDYNRLVIVSFQGTQLQEQLTSLRGRLTALLAANKQRNTYAERVLGSLAADSSSRHSEIG